MALSTDKSSKPYVRYLPFVPNGEVNIPPSKSDVHRAIICAALTRGKCTIAPVALSNDIKATIGVIEDMGCTASIKDGVLTVDGTNIFKTDNVTLDCGEPHIYLFSLIHPLLCSFHFDFITNDVFSP